MTAREAREEVQQRARAALSVLPFVTEVTERREGAGVVWEVRTSAGDVFRLVPRSVQEPPGPREQELIVARRLSRRVQDELLEQKANFIDSAGNLHIELGERYFAHIEGKRLARPLPAMGAASYRVLLAWLMSPELLSASIRETAAVAEVSTTPVVDMQKRLDAWGHVVGSPPRRVWTPRGRKEARRMWLDGYRSTLRPKLDMGGYRLRGAGPSGSNLSHVRDELGRVWSQQSRDEGSVGWGWGGAEALRHVEATSGRLLDGGLGGGPVITLFVDPAIDDVSARIPIAASDTYNIRVRHLPFRAAMQHEGPAGWPASVPHPLMVWTELMCDPDPRVREVAEVLEREVPEGWL